MAVTELFDDFDTLDSATWQSVFDGGGSASASNSKVLLSQGGAAADDVSALVLKTPLDLASNWIAYAQVNVTGDFPAAYTPNIMGIYDTSGIPGVLTAAERTAAQRIWIEDQSASDSVGTNNRWQIRLRNTSAALENWRNSTGDWSTTFQHSHTQATHDNNITIAITNVAGSGIRFTTIGYDSFSTTSRDCGARLVGDTTWRVFGTNITAVSNDAYLVFGDLVNDAGTLDQVLTIEWFALYELLGTNDEYFIVANAATAAFPYPYNLHRFVCPRGMQQNGTPLLIPYDNHPGSSKIVDRGADNWVQDPYGLEV